MSYANENSKLVVYQSLSICNLTYLERVRTVGKKMQLIFASGFKSNENHICQASVRHKT